MNEPIHITDDSFEKVVTSTKGLLIVDFWAPWCGYCKMLTPHLDKVAKEYEDRLIVAKINVDENPVKSQEFDVQMIPTLLFYKDGELVFNYSGALQYGQLKNMIEEHI